MVVKRANRRVGPRSRATLVAAECHKATHHDAWQPATRRSIERWLKELEQADLERRRNLGQGIGAIVTT